MRVDTRVSERLVHARGVLQRVEAPELRCAAPVVRLPHVRMAIVHLKHDLINERMRPVGKQRLHDVELIPLHVHLDDDRVGWLQAEHRLQKVGEADRRRRRLWFRARSNECLQEEVATRKGCRTGGVHALLSEEAHELVVRRQLVEASDGFKG